MRLRLLVVRDLKDLDGPGWRNQRVEVREELEGS